MADVYRSAGLEAALIAGVHPEMDRAAERLASVVRSEAAKSVKTGHFLASIKTAAVPGKRGVTDRIVYTDDPNAWSIEYGHRDKRSGKWVEGKFAFKRGSQTFR